MPKLRVALHWLLATWNPFLLILIYFWCIFSHLNTQPWWTVNHNHVAEPKDWPLTQAGALTSLPESESIPNDKRQRLEKGQTLFLTGNPWGECASVLPSTSPLMAWFLFPSFSETHFFKCSLSFWMLANLVPLKLIFCLLYWICFFCLQLKQLIVVS